MLFHVDKEYKYTLTLNCLHIGDIDGVSSYVKVVGFFKGTGEPSFNSGGIRGSLVNRQ